MKKLLFFVCLALLLVISPAVYASGDHSYESGSKVHLDFNLSITKFEDGRVAPVPNANTLSDAQVRKVLLEMNVTNQEIDELPDSFKRNLISRGGVKVNVDTTLQKYYRSISGERYLITEDNMEDIDRIKQQDISKIKESSSEVRSLGMGSVTDGKFSGTALVFYIGKTANNAEFRYDYYTTYSWYPGTGLNFYWWDSVAHAWQYHTTSVSHSGANNIQLYSTNPSLLVYPYSSSDFTLSVGGTKANFDLFGNGYREFGALHNEVRIPVAHKGTTGTFISSYVHPYFSGIVGVVLTYLGIDWASFTGDEWNWSNTFTIQNS